MATHKQRRKRQSNAPIVIMSFILIIIIIIVIFLIKSVFDDDIDALIINSGEVTDESTVDTKDSTYSNSVSDEPFESSNDNTEITETDETTETSETTAEDIENIECADEFYNMSSDELLQKLGGGYDESGYESGGFFIANNKVYPKYKFFVPCDEKNNVIDGEITTIIVLEGGYITKGVNVGMTFDEIKSVIGDKITLIDGMTAQISNSNYTAIIEFESSGGKSNFCTMYFNK